MRRTFLYGLLGGLFFLLSAAPAASQRTIPIAVGDPFPEIFLTPSAAAEHREYLGVEGPTFTPSQIDAEVVLVELLNVHCPDCWTQVAEYNELFFILSEDPDGRKNIKMLGIAVGNSSEEVAAFVERLQVAYPVVADPHFTAADATGTEIIPATFYLRQSAANEPGIVADTHHGLVTGHQQMLAQLKAVARQSHAQLRREGEQAIRTRTAIETLFTREELEYRARTLMLEGGGRIRDFGEVALRSGRRVYTAVMERDDRHKRLFAEVVASPPAGNLGRDGYFIYAFDEAGKVVAFAPMPVTQNGRVTWTKEEVDWMRRQVVGRYLGAPWSLEPQAAAHTSANAPATIVSRSLAQGAELLRELRAKRLVGEQP